MQPERQTVALALMGLATVALGVLAERPVLIAGGVALAAWLIGRQAAAFRVLRRVDRDLEIETTPARRTVAVDAAMPVALTATLDRPAPAPVDVHVALPIAADGPPTDDRTLRIETGETEARTTVECSFPTAGRFTFPEATVDVAPRDGLFSETCSGGPTPTVTVEPRTPRDLQISRGGEEIASAYGEHEAKHAGGGITPEEIRKYQPGDAADQIDWKATARLGELYVREYEAETDRRTLLVVDHRAGTALGPHGTTLFDYAREAALVYVGAAERFADTLGCWTVGDHGVTGQFDPTSTAAGYRRIRAHLRDLRPTDEGRDRDGTNTGRTDAQPTPAAARTDGSGQALRPGEAARRRARLADDSSAFATRLEPYLASRDSYVHRMESDPLFGTVERARAETTGTRWTVIVTDDARRGQVREAARLATRGGDRAVVFLAPRVLFEPDALADPERAYEQYVDFERFRRELEGLSNVTAFEVGPGDRLERVLAAGRRRR